MFIVKIRLTVSRASKWKHCRLSSTVRMRVMLPNSIDKQKKRNEALGNNKKVAQGGRGGSSGSRCSVSSIQAQGSINANQKGKLTARQEPIVIGAQLQTSFVINPYSQFLSARQCLAAAAAATTTTTGFVQQRQLSNVSFNRNAKAGARGGVGSQGGVDSEKKKKNSAAAVSKFNEEIGNYQRRWHKVRKESFTSPGIDFSLMNYNVLSQELLDKHPELYRHHHRSTLQWSERFRNLMNEIKHHNSDILCLQEVQESHLDDFYLKQMTGLGYKGIYKKRTGNCPDGCAIFYKHNTFKLLEYINVEFLQQPNAQLLNRDNIALIAKFAPVNNQNAQFLVATTHLLYNPRRDDVRVAQIQLLLTEIERMSYNETNYIPIILTGDFNSLPTSFPVNFINSANLNYVSLPRKYGQNQNQWIPHQLGITDYCQHLALMQNRQTKEYTNLSRDDEREITSIQHTDRKQKPQQNEQLYAMNLFNTGYLRHVFTFKSVYDHSIKGNPEATTYQDDWKTVDYIFYSMKKDAKGNKRDDKLVLLAKYTLPTDGHLNGVTIPNRNLGSDHLSLLAKFRLVF